MRRVTLGTRAAARVVIAAPTGGVDVTLPPSVIRDDRLAEAVNVHLKSGRLTTRPAVTETQRFERAGMTVESTPLGRAAFVHAFAGETHFFGLADGEGQLVGSERTMTGVSAVTPVPCGENGAVLLLIDGSACDMLVLQPDGTLTEVTPTVPTLLIGGRPTAAMVREASGALFEAPNLLGEQFTCRYTADGTGLYYWLPEGVAPDMAAAFSVTYDDLSGGTLTHTVSARDGTLWYESDDDPLLVDELRLCYSAREGCFWFRHAHGSLAAPLPAGNVTLAAALPDRKSAVCRLRFGTWYGARLFLAGEGATLRWSAAGDALYFPENNVSTVGTADEPITALAVQSDLLAVFKERSLYAARPVVGTVTAEDLIAGAVTDVEAATAFPISPVHPACGCDLPHTLRLHGDRLVWACSDGSVCTLVSGGTYGVRSVRRLSAPIAAALSSYTVHQWRRASAAVHEGQYLLLVEGTVYVLAAEPTEEHAVWHLWTLPQHGVLTEARHRALFLTSDAVHAFTDDAEDVVGFRGTPITCTLTTKHYELGDGTAYKRLQTLTLWLAGDVGGRVRVQVEGREAATLTLKNKETPYVLPLGGRRVRRAAVTVTAEGRVTLDRLGVTYRITGEMRE